MPSQWCVARSGNRGRAPRRREKRSQKKMHALKGSAPITHRPLTYRVHVWVASIRLKRPTAAPNISVSKDSRLSTSIVCNVVVLSPCSMNQSRASSSDRSAKLVKLDHFRRKVPHVSVPRANTKQIQRGSFLNGSVCVSKSFNTQKQIHEAIQF